MLSTDAHTAALAYYAAHKCALFPILHGSKNPLGIVSSFANEHSANPTQWDLWWDTHHCNFGLVAGPSKLIVVDIDAKDDRNAAWTAWCELCANWGIAVASPQVTSARGGWHVLFRVPDDVDASALRQPDAVKKLINVRAGNGYVVAAGSYYDGTAKGEASGHYTLLCDAAPYPAPPKLIEHCTRSNSPVATKTTGRADPDHVRALILWLSERDAFEDYESWVSVGMSIKLELPDQSGLDLWSLTFDDNPTTPDLAASKWNSFDTEPGPQSVTLGTWIKRARDMGFKGAMLASLDTMFGGAVAALAAGAGATTQAQQNLTVVGADFLAELGKSPLDEFMNATATEPNSPLLHDFPTLPESMAGHPLYEPVRSAVSRVFAMAERKSLKKSDKRTVEPMAVLYAMEQTRTTYEAVKSRLRVMGFELPESVIIPRAGAYESKVQRSQRTGKSWVRNDKSGECEHNNPDNVEVLLHTLGLEVRWNDWLNQIEIQGGREANLSWSEWTRVDDSVVAALITRASETGTRFCPSDAFVWRTLLAFSRASRTDPMLDYLNSLEVAWDRLPRLDMWLAAVLRVPNDDYLRGVGRNIIGGMVRRIRNPGSKHDTTAIFCGAQGKNKSTLGMVIADMGQRTLAEIRNGGTPCFSSNIKLGDDATVLLQMLRGKTLVEFSEMAMRGTANVEAVKAMLTNQEDEGREPYARAPVTRPRRNIFYATSNNDQPLTDPTGNRRWLPVSVPDNLDVEWLSGSIRLLVGEACALERTGENFMIPVELEDLANQKREDARTESPVESAFTEWFRAGPFSNNACITSKELGELCRAAGFERVSDNTKAAQMKKLGFIKAQHVSGPGRGWVRGTKAIAVEYKWTRTPEGRVQVTIRQGGVS